MLEAVRDPDLGKKGDNWARQIEEAKHNKKFYSKEGDKKGKPQKAKKGTERVEEVDKHNEIFERYYKELKIVPEQEWDAFYATLQKPLNICFRVNSIDRHAQKTKA